MSILAIVHYPDPRLAIKSKPVEKIDDTIRTLVADMYETMYEAKGVGLAGVQVGVHLRLFTYDVSEEHNQPHCIINPEIISKEGVLADKGEGCLSVPYAYDKVDRAAYVHLRGMNLAGEPVDIHAEGLLAHMFQHEVDHLDGVLFINYLSRLKQNRIRAKLLKQERK